MLQEDPPGKSRSSPPRTWEWVALSDAAAVEIRVPMPFSSSHEPQEAPEEDYEFCESILADPDKGISGVIAFAHSREGSPHD